MGIRRRGYDLAAFVRAYAANKIARDEASRIVQRWNDAIATGADIWHASGQKGVGRYGSFFAVRVRSFSSTGRPARIAALYDLK
jgi:hypothetical protein